MRELSLVETGYLAGMLLLSLVLPVLMGVLNVRDIAVRKRYMKIVWIGQTGGFLAGIGILASGFIAPYAAVFGVVGYLACVLVILRQFRAERQKQAV